MTDPILIDHETSTDLLMDVLERILDVLTFRIGPARVTAILFGTAVRIVMEKVEADNGG